MLSNLISQWKMNDNAANTIVVDSRGSNNGISNRNTSIISVSGKINEALDLDYASSDRIDCGLDSSLQTNLFSISTWIKVEGASGTHQQILGNNGTDFKGFGIAMLSNRTLNFVVGDGSTWGININPGSTLTYGTHYNIIMTFDGTNGILYVNNSSWGTDTLAGSITYDAAKKFWIGVKDGSSLYFNGEIDDTRYYDKELSASERAQLYNSGNGTEDNFDSLVLADTITLTDANNLPEAILEDTITLSDTATSSPAHYATRIIKLDTNTMLVCTDTDPAEIIEVDISGGTPTFIIHTLLTAKNAQDVTVNSTFNKIYVACKNGKVVKLSSSDLTDKTLLDTLDTDDLTNIDCLDAHYYTYAGSDDSSGEIILIDESEITKLNSDIRFLLQKDI
ncbi:hypothetical protein LCGC14_2103190, partial [marine sediment metagenome]